MKERREERTNEMSSESSALSDNKNIIGEKKIRVEFLQDIQEFVCVDEQTYGPYKAGDKALIPIEHSKILIKRKIARIDKEWLRLLILKRVFDKGCSKKEFEAKLDRIARELETELGALKEEGIIAIIKTIVKQIKELGYDIVKPLTVEELIKILGSTIKHDDINKIITFLNMLASQTEESQFNVSFRAPSSTGKSYIPIELSEYFPKDVVKLIAYTSPTAFFHEMGEWDNERKCIIVDLERKILIFLDQPHDQLLQRLRPLLSHDQKELLCKITDKKERHGLRTKNVILKGFPSVIFCTGSLKMDEQEATRNFVLSPETNEEKIRESIYLKALRKGNPLAFRKMLESNLERKALMQRIELIRKERIKYVIIRDYEKVVEEFKKRFPKLKPRHTRDIERIISLAQSLALLNFWQREKDHENNLYAEDEDVEIAFRLFGEIAESQELGIPPYIYNLFKEVIEPLYLEVNKDNKEAPIGLTRKQIIAKHLEVYGRPLQDWFLRREILPALESAGLIAEEPDPNDRRRMLIYVTTPQSSSLYSTPQSNFTPEKYREIHSGLDKTLDELTPKQEKEIHQTTKRMSKESEWFLGRCSWCGEVKEVMRFKDGFICKECVTYEI